MFRSILADENTKIYRRKLLWIEMGLFALTIGLVFVLMNSALRINPAGRMNGPNLAAMQQAITWPAGLKTSLGFASGDALGGMLVIVLVGTLTAQEYGWRTFQLWLGNGVSRSRLLTGKFLALLPPLVLIPLAALAAGAIVSIALTLNINGTVNLGSVDLTQLGWSLLRTVWTLLPYGALTFFLAIVTRSTVGAIAGGIGYALVVEGILLQVLSLGGDFLAKIPSYLPGGMSSGLLALNGGSRLMGPGGGTAVASSTSLDPWQAAVGLGAYTLVFLGLALWTFRRQDLTSSE